MNTNIEGKKIGIDVGASTVKIVAVENGSIKHLWLKPHCGKILPTVIESLKNLPNGWPSSAIAITGQNSSIIKDAIENIYRMDDIPAVIDGTKYVVPNAGCIIEIGSQGARFITDLDKSVPSFSVNEHCAGGTGSFFEDQMNRLGMKIEDYSKTVEKAESIPRLSGRCAVFAKTDIIHRQQEGVSTPDILLGLCYAMIRNFKATIIRDLNVKKPIVFCGGVTENAGAVKAVKDVFSLQESELIVPEYRRFVAAIGAAFNAQGEFKISEIIEKLNSYDSNNSFSKLAPLHLSADINLNVPDPTQVLPETGLSLGIDIGSTSTDLVLIDDNGTLIDYLYLRTAGNPERAVRGGFAKLKEKYGNINISSVGVTGSGRERMGKMLGADVIIDEITAQARGAISFIPDVDTVFEIGGQDSKFISIKNAQVVDFQMNKICAAGTGSFIEEQSIRMNIPISVFGQMAMTASKPADLGERCTVFIETAIASAVAEGISTENIAAGLCYSIVKNYLHKVVGGKHVGHRIVLQGGVAYNPGIVAAFRSYYGDKLTVNPYFSISGAYGVAKIAQEAKTAGNSTFKGFEFESQIDENIALAPSIRRNIEFYQKAGKLLLEGYDGKIDPHKKTVGIPYVLMIHKFFPMANAFFKSLGYNVLLTKPTNEDTIRLSQELAKGETCYPIKLIYGHMQQLIDLKVDYIFLPSIHTMKHESSSLAHNYGCVYMQTAPASIAKILHLEEKGIELLNPVFDLDFGKQAMAMAMLGLGKQLRKPKPFCMKALAEGAANVRRHGAEVEKMGQQLLSTIQPDEKVLVLITRNYGVSDPILNMGIPELLLERNCKVITLSHLPAHDLDISSEYPNLYWPFGQHIISGAKIIANHPNLYAVYLTNHGCGPDTMISHMFKEIMGDKPYLQIEVDEHFSKVGVITRIEAFLNSLTSQPTAILPKNFDLKNVPMKKVNLPDLPDKEKTVCIPDLNIYSKYISMYLENNGYKTKCLPAFTHEMLDLGRTVTSSKEYIQFPALMGQILYDINNSDTDSQYLVFSTRGAEADGQLPRIIRSELDSLGYTDKEIVTPMLELLIESPNLDSLVRAIALGDVLMCIPKEMRGDYEFSDIPNWDVIINLAKKAGNIPVKGRLLAAVGTPLMMISLDDGILEQLDNSDDVVIRASLLEYLYVLWKDQEESKKYTNALNEIKSKITELSEALGNRSCYSTDSDLLFKTADKYLPKFAGANGRYRFAKIIDMGNKASAVINISPRYENTAMVMEMRNISSISAAPVFSLSLDGDWDESGQSRLNSFLYYCKK